MGAGLKYIKELHPEFLLEMELFEFVSNKEFLKITL